MDASIILQGQQPNVLAAIAGGNMAAQQQINNRNQNALTGLYQAQGPGIAAGDPQALNALSRLDPMAALGVNQTRQQMALSAEEMQMRRAEAANAAAAHAAQIGADQAAQQAAIIERGVSAAIAAQTPEQWDQIVTQFGAQDLVGQFGNRDAIINSYLGVAEGLKRMTPQPIDAPEGYMPDPANPTGAVKPIPGIVAEQPKPADDYQRYVQEEAAAGRAPLSRLDFAQAMNGSETIYGPDGNPIVVRGPAGAGKPMTEAQSKDVVFATRAEGALQTLDPVADELSSRSGRVADMDPTGIARGMVQSDAFQVAKNAAIEFTTAILRKDSGAAITKEETQLMDTLYLPQPGDNKAVLDQKRVARKRAVDAIKAGMSPDQIIAQERGLSGSTAPTGPVVIDGFTIEEQP